MANLSVDLHGIKLKNPFVIASGPPGTNGDVIMKAHREGWGAVIAKTISLHSGSVTNLIPRYAKLKAPNANDIIGWENIELISDRPFETWIDEFKQLKDADPDVVLIASIMEEYRKDAWVEIVERCQEVGVDGLELNFSCPHGHPEQKMGAAMGEVPEIAGEVAGWVSSVAKVPVWAKLSPNVDELAYIMEQHQFNSVGDMLGFSLRYFKTHGELVELQKQAKFDRKASVLSDKDWSGENFVEQTKSLLE